MEPQVEGGQPAERASKIWWKAGRTEGARKSLDFLPQILIEAVKKEWLGFTMSGALLIKKGAPS